jgi:hypothetical protein
MICARPLLQAAIRNRKVAILFRIASRGQLISNDSRRCQTPRTRLSRTRPDSGAHS